MILVTCFFVLLDIDGYRSAPQITGKLISDEHETWIVDITDYIKSHPKLSNNNLVQFVKETDCMYARLQK